MKHHLFCLTTDTDPDGLSGQSTNRRALEWKGLTQAQRLPGDLHDLGHSLDCPVPLTWFIRVDGQMRDLLGTSLYLLQKFEDFWNQVSEFGHELGWHPHLYRQAAQDDEPTLITDSTEACDELEQLWDDLRTCSFIPTAFRNGEGWHCAQTLATVEKLGFLCDSTAIPGRRGGDQHPMNWLGTLNQPYFPDSHDIRVSGVERPLLEIPMNTWRVQAPYESQPQVRYMNPAIHEALFAGALDGWEKDIASNNGSLWVWVLIFHPDEVMPIPTADLLYAHSTHALCRNILAMTARVQSVGHSFEFVTLSEAALRWKQHKGLSS